MKQANQRIASRYREFVFAAVMFLATQWAFPSEPNATWTASPLNNSAPEFLIGPFKNNEDWLKFVQGLVHKYYPATFTRMVFPAGYTLGFLLKDRETAIRHAEFIDQSPDGTSDLQTLRNVFPEDTIDGSTEHGVMCFPAEKRQHGRFCAMYVVAKRSSIRSN